MYKFTTQRDRIEIDSATAVRSEVNSAIYHSIAFAESYTVAFGVHNLLQLEG